MLTTHHSDLVHLYDEATTNLGNAQYVSCIDNCRSLFESFFKKLDTVDNDYVKGILKATGETVVENGAQLTSIKKYIPTGLLISPVPIVLDSSKQCIVQCRD